MIVKNGKSTKTFITSVLSVTLVSLSVFVSSFAATPGIPFVENFSAANLKNNAKTTAKWSVKRSALVQSFRNAQSGGLTNLSEGFDISSDNYSEEAIATGDIDGDGDQDVIAASLNNSIRYYLNNGSSSPFVNVVGVDIATPGLRTKDIAIGDIDSDGDLDLVVAREAHGYPATGPAVNYIYLNNGSSNPFNGTVAIPISNDSYPSTSIVLADMNSDGHLDVVSGSANQENRIYINNTTSTPFTDAGSSIGTDINNSTDIAVADFNNDGRPDVAVVNNRDSSNNLSESKYYLNDGVGDLFDTSISQDLGTNTFSGDDPSIAVGDMDSDGDIDVVGVGSGSFIYFNDGGADPFPVGTAITSLPHPRALGVDLGDVDSDGDIDIVLATFSGERQKLFLNNGTLTPFSDSNFLDLTADSLDTRAIKLHDMDNDGDLDIVSANYNGTNRLYINERSNNPFNSLPGIGVTADESDTNEIIFVDIDQDGDQDIVTANWNNNKLYLNNGTSDPFNAVTAFDISRWFDAANPNGTSYAVLAEDFDNDGDIDIAFGERSAIRNRLYLNDGSGNPFDTDQYVYQNIGTESYDTNYTVSLTAGDVDNDGDIDLIASNAYSTLTNGQNTSTNKLYLNNGTSTPFTSAGLIIDPGNSDSDRSSSGVLKDVNNDGYLDYVVGNTTGSNKVYINNRTSNPFNGVSSSYIGIDASEDTTSLSLGDINSDGLVDVIVASNSTFHHYYLNNGTNSPFQGVTAGTFLLSSNQGNDSILADIDKDGDLDALFAKDGHNHLYLNNGTSGPFENVQPIEVSTDVGTFESFAVADADNDGDLDLLSATFGINSIYFNQSAAESFIAIRESVIDTTVESTWSIAIADMDNDGDLDSVHGNRYSSNRIYMNNNTAAPFLNAMNADITSDNQSTYDIAVEDMNHDGFKDVVVANSGRNYLYLSDGVGDLFDTSVGLPIGAVTETDTSWAVDIADINQDGHPDVVFGNASAVNLFYLNNGTSLPFNGVTSNTVDGLDTDTTYGIKAVDIDLDGDIDIVALNNGINRLYLNSGGIFADGSGVNISADSAASYDAAVGDVDRDGLPDLVIANYSNAANRLYLNDGSGNPFDSIAGTNISADAVSTISIALLDIDNDGDLDVITPNYNAADSFYLNDGTVNGDPFSTTSSVLLATDSTPTYQAWDVGIGDVDGDGNQDIVIANYGDSNRLIRSLAFDNTKNKAESVEVDTDIDILHATLTPAITIPNLTSVNWYLSNDGGKKYYSVKPGVEFTFPQLGDDLRWKVELNSLTPLESPIVDTIGINARFDHDQDLVADDVDNCVGTYNPVPQTDTNNDGEGDACDTDDDGDLVLDINDAFTLNASESSDTDGDCPDTDLVTSGTGCGDNSDPDIDNDGILNGSDPFDFNIQPSISGTPSVVAIPDSLYNFMPAISDGGDGPTLIASLTFEGGTNANLPPWLSFNPSTGQLTGLPSNDDYATSFGDTNNVLDNIVITVSDSVQTSALPAFSITMQDTRAPNSLAVPSGGNFNASVDARIFCLENIGSGCNTIRYTMDDAAVKAGFNTVAGSTTTITIDSATNTNLRFYSVDADGNEGNIVTESYNFDLDFPVINITAPAAGALLDTLDAVTGTSSDTGTGVNQVRIQITDGLNSVQSVGADLTDGDPVWLPVATSDGYATWSYPRGSINWVPDTDYIITASVADEAGNITTTSTSFTYYSGQPASTSLTLSLTSSAIPNNDMTDATLTFTRLNNTEQDQTGTEILLHVTDPDGVVLPDIVTTTNFAGQVTVTLGTGDVGNISFDTPGQYLLEAEFSGNIQMAAVTSSTVNLLVGSSAGYAVIVQGKLPNESGLESHNKTANRIYDTLKDRGFVDQDITYFNYDASQNGVDGVPTKAAVQTAIESLYSEIQLRPAPVYIIMVDHGGELVSGVSEAVFYLDDETITPTELDSWLDTLEGYLATYDTNNLTDLLGENKRVVIMGACYSGGFVPGVSSSGRVVISSASAHEQSYKGPTEDDGIRVGEYFLEELFLELSDGSDLRTAFQQATTKTETWTRGGDLSANSANGFNDDAVQHPLMDDDADTVGTNAVFVNSSDGQSAKEIVLGFNQDSLTNDAFTPADITQVGDTLYLDNTTSAAQLELYANDPYQVNQAYVEIRTPDKTLSSSGNDTTEQLSNDYLRRAFTPPTTSGAPYTMDYSDFVQKGLYEIFYYVNDRFTGALSPAKRSLVYKDRDIGSGANQPPGSFNLLTPGATSWNGTDTEQTILAFDWEDAIDADLDSKVTYTLLLADDSGFTSFSSVDNAEACSANNVIYKQEELTSSSTFINEAGKLCDDHSYYWKVIAVDEYGQHTFSTDTFIFHTDDTNAQIGTIVAMVQSNVTSAQLTGANISNNFGESASEIAVVVYNGNYVILTSHVGEAQVISTSLTGYTTPDISGITVADRSTVEILISMDPAVDTDSDADGVFDINDNCPSTANASQTNSDSDSQGDACDLDDDDDGMSDVFEAANSLDSTNPADASADPDGDGATNLQEAQAGTDPNVEDDVYFPDTDGDGVTDNRDNCISIYNTDQTNTDLDAEGDACDNDDDNDGMPDTFEQLYGLNVLINDAALDADIDGFTNLEEFGLGTNPVIENNDTVDSDGDGITDFLDNCPADSNVNQSDLDNDTAGDVCDLDRDGDSVANISDIFPDDPDESADSDTDGTGDNADTDDDNDGMSDFFELLYGLNPNDATDATDDGDSDGFTNLSEFQLGTNPSISNNTTSDTDGDGSIDVLDNCPQDANASQLDSDFDGQGDICDLDRDNDGITNSADEFPDDVSESVDSDTDGTGNNADTDDDDDNMSDAFELLYGLNPLDASDASGDADGDGVSNIDEFHNFTNPLLDNADLNDSDGDGTRDVEDNCPSLANPTQSDTDADRQGDSCDSDDDNDGMPDSFETDNGFNSLDASDAVLDADGDGLTNLQEFYLNQDPNLANASGNDTDFDTVADNIDNCPALSNSDQTDTDSDGAGNICDDDDDGDGMPDNFELIYQLDPLSATDAAEDADSDGISNLDEFLGSTSPKSSDLVPAAEASSGGGGGLVPLFLLYALLCLYWLRRVSNRNSRFTH